MSSSATIRVFLCIMALAMIMGCRHGIEDNLAFPVRAVDKPSEVSYMVPEIVTDSVRNFIDVRLFEDKVLYLCSPALMPGVASYMLRVEDTSGKVLASLFPMGRGPGEMLSPLPHIDVYRGQAYLIDVMNSRCVTADLSESISNGHTVISHSVVFDHKGSSHLVFPSFYALGDASLLAFDTGLTGAERNGEYSYAPRYSMYVLHSGEKIKDYECFTLGEKKKSGARAVKQPAFSLNDCMDDSRRRVCFAMSKGPIIGFINLESGEMYGVKVKDCNIKGSKELPRFYFGPVASKGERVFAMYYGALGDKTTRTPDLYEFNWCGDLLKVYQLDTFYNHMWAEEDGLYLTKVEREEDGMIICRISWDQLEIR